MTILLDTAKQNDLIYDVGLHHGQDTDFYLKKGYRVIGFEAAPRNVAHCRTRFEREIADGRLTIVEGAITENISRDDETEDVTFYRNPDHSLWGSTSVDWVERNKVLGTRSDIIKVPAVDFAECLEKYGIPHYMKADIVGSETICLRALLKFKNKPDYLSIRSEKVIFRKLEHEFELLEQLGYHSFKAVKQDFERIRPQVPSNNGAKYHEFEDGASGPFGEESPGSWIGRDAVLKRYQRVFVRYWLFGDYSYLIQTETGRKLISGMERIIKRSIPGWYDTHAKHQSLDKDL